MAETSKPKPRTALFTSLAALSAAGATWLAAHAVAPAQAQPHPHQQGLATADQVAALERKVDRFIERVEAVEKKQAFEDGRAAREVNFRERQR